MRAGDVSFIAPFRYMNLMVPVLLVLVPLALASLAAGRAGVRALLDAPLASALRRGAPEPAT